MRNSINAQLHKCTRKSVDDLISCYIELKESGRDTGHVLIMITYY